MKKVILILTTLTILLNSITAPIVTVENKQYVQCGLKNPVNYEDCSVADLAIDMFCCKVKIGGTNQCLLLSKPNRIDFKAKYGSDYDCPNSASFAKFSAVIFALFVLLLA